MLVAALLGACLTSHSHAQSSVVVITPDPVGYARQLVATRGDDRGDLNLSDPRAAGLELASPGKVPATSPGPVTARAVSTLSLMSGTSTLDSARLLQDADVYRPLTTQLITKPDLVYQPPTNTGIVPPTLPPGSTPSSGPTAEEIEAARRRQEIREAQEREQRNKLERESQQRVFELLQGKVQEIAALKKKRKEDAEKRLEQRNDIRGPSALSVINLLDGLYIDRGVNLDQSDILRIDHHLYQDANPATGLYYYAPKRYDLQWDPQNQYAMTVIYGMAGQKEGEGEVFMATRLQAGVDLAELQLAEELLRAYLRRNAETSGTRFRELRPLPLAAASDVELFGGANNEFTVPPDKISVQGITGLLDSMDVSWATDVRRLLNVESLLRTDAGIHGSITMHASGQEKLSRAIPLEIAVASHETFGRIPFDRARGWVNTSRYPIRLDTLHALLLAPESGNGLRKDQPIVLTWNLGGAVIPPGVGVSWNAGWVPAWIDSRAKVVWIRYGVDGACDACDELVFTEKFIPPPPSTREIQFTTGDVFEVTSAYQIRIHVRSPFLDPQRNRVLEQPGVMLDKDGVEYPIARLFLTDREMTGAGTQVPFYEFQVEVVMRDGKVHQSGWTQTRTLDYLLGSASLREVLGYLPGEEKPAS
jgi:hypothetical protein